MVDSPSTPATSQPTEPDVRSRGGRARSLPWALLSLAFLAFLSFGTVPTRIWRFNELQVEWKPVRRIWQVQFDSLPQVEHQWLINGVFLVSIVLFVIGVITGIWLLLARSPVADAS
jgi:hypothetical protein